MKRKILLMILFIFVISLESAASQNYSDWARESIAKLEIFEITNGSFSSSNNLKAQISREEFAEISVKIHQFLTGDSLESFGVLHPFEDVKNNNYIACAYKLGYIKGISLSKFKPKGKITREQIATIIYRQISSMRKNLAKNTKINEKFADDYNISDWARDGVYFCKNLKIIEGVGKNTFDSKSNASKEAVYKIYQYALSNIFKKDLKEASHREMHGLNDDFMISNSEDSYFEKGDNQKIGLELRLKTKKTSSKENYNIHQASYELYEILKDRFPDDVSINVAKALRDNFSKTELLYSVNKSINNLHPKIKIRFSGDAYIDIVK